MYPLQDTTSPDLTKRTICSQAEPDAESYSIIAPPHRSMCVYLAEEAEAIQIKVCTDADAGDKDVLVPTEAVVFVAGFRRPGIAGSVSAG
jgi:hypothetical protein